MLADVDVVRVVLGVCHVEFVGGVWELLELLLLIV